MENWIRRVGNTATKLSPPLLYLLFFEKLFSSAMGSIPSILKSLHQTIRSSYKTRVGETNETIDKTPERQRRPTYFFRLCLEAKCGAMTMRRPLFIQPVFGENIRLDAGEMTDLAFFQSNEMITSSRKYVWLIMVSLKTKELTDVY